MKKFGIFSLIVAFIVGAVVFPMLKPMISKVIKPKSDPTHSDVDNLDDNK